MSQDILYLSQEDVISCGGMSMKDAIEDLMEVYKLFDKGDCILPGKVVVKWPGKNTEETIGRINAMPAYIGGKFSMYGIKWIGSGPNNPKKYGLPRASAIIVLNNPETMMPLAIMDGTVISAIRTGAVTGICAKYLAPKNSESVCLIGAGTQNRTQITALKTIIPSIKKASVYDISKDRCIKFASDMSKALNIEVVPVLDRKEALENADIIVTATTATDPLVFVEDIKDGCYLAHIGGNEVDNNVILKANKVVVDDWEMVKHRMGDTLSYMYADGLIGDDKIYSSVSDLVCGKKIGRENNNELIYTCNVGLGIYDIAIAARVYANAINSGIGIKLHLWNNPAMV